MAIKSKYTDNKHVQLTCMASGHLMFVLRASGLQQQQQPSSRPLMQPSSRLLGCDLTHCLPGCIHSFPLFLSLQLSVFMSSTSTAGRV